MHIPRRIALAGTLLTLTFAYHPSPSPGQAPAKAGDPFRKEGAISGAARSRVNEMRDGKLSFTNKADLERYRQDLREMAEHLVFQLTHEELYDHQQPINRRGELMPVANGTPAQLLFEEVSRFIIKPTPTTKIVAEQADYLKEFGAAMDAAIKKVLNPNAPDYIRVNAARMLALAAQSGAPAHAPTITALLKDPNTRPEILIYALKAAENLLAAYDPFKYMEKDAAKHTIDDAQLYALCVALEDIVDWHRAPWMKSDTPTPADASPPAPAGGPKPTPAGPRPAAPPAPPALPGPRPGPAAAGQLENVTEAQLTPDDLQVLKFFRRAAIRALAQVRFPIVAHPNGKDVTRPMWTLAKIAVNDASVAPPTGPGEVGEAVIGLCGYQAFRGVEVDVLLDVIAAGLINFAAWKTDDHDNKSIHWRVYATRLIVALDQFRKGGRENAGLTRFAARIGSLADTATNDVLTPIERYSPGAANVRPPDPEALAGWRARNPVPTLQPFTDVKNLVLKPAIRMR